MLYLMIYLVKLNCFNTCYMLIYENNFEIILICLLMYLLIFIDL